MTQDAKQKVSGAAEVAKVGGKQARKHCQMSVLDGILIETLDRRD